jgi:hypothetical protein
MRVEVVVAGAAPSGNPPGATSPSLHFMVVFDRTESFDRIGMM